MVTKQVVGFTVLLLVLAAPVSAQSKRPQAADPGIASILFFDPTSAIARLGKSPPLTDEHVVFAHARYVNADRSESLALVFHPGSRFMDVAEAIVERPAPGAAYPSFPGSIKRFESSRGISLGLTKAEVRRILGAPTSETPVSLKYVLDKTNAKEWLAEYNLPRYYGTYEFTADKLTKFSFGFEYP